MRLRYYNHHPTNLTHYYQILSRTVQWSAWLAHTRPHPPTIEVCPLLSFFFFFLFMPGIYFSSKELQADIVRQQRVLANVALIEARDRAEEQERFRIRQEDTQKALQRALTDVSSASGEYSHQEQEEARSRDESLDKNTNTAVSDISGEQKLGLEGEVGEVASPVSNSGQPMGLKIRPPAFLTPAKSSKSHTMTSISSSVFTAPLDVAKTTERLAQGALGGEHPCQRKKADQTESLDTTQSAGSDSQTQKPTTSGASPLPVMPSRVAETESWTPKARARR